MRVFGPDLWSKNILKNLRVKKRRLNFAPLLGNKRSPQAKDIEIFAIDKK